MRTFVRLLCCLPAASLALVVGDPAMAQDETVKLDASRDYLIGASLTSSAPMLGSDTSQRLRLRPMWAFQLGRFRFATSGASALLTQGRQTVDTGVSTVVAGSDRWSLSTSLQLDEGRSWDGDRMFQGLPDVRATLRGRLAANIALGKRWSASLRGSQDLLGREGGLRIDSGLNYRYPVSSQTHWDLALGAGWANGTFQRTFYGIAPDAAAATGLPIHQPGSGWDNTSLSWRLTSALNRHWVMYGGVSVLQLQGAAASSPLTGRRTAYGATVGLAYRND
ncbi:MipA/OmpV family protein [Hydrogenophaga sp.]|uniref:MipA/OmpV family protein n=1 Tax=Hydrogenophaga sp. TaxID=1904254 RepID=UPI00261B0ACD|nr:MipA/OmpV family protein [Hydrogenophaga sp.]MCW5653977.1 MipA/OmpV family protein [Hydrogenophaga sp.]